ncbi:MAG: DNA polymerase I [Chloroflexi bacterium]|nr:DNA polymerase I [Chloroflexota bacterium]
MTDTLVLIDGHALVFRAFYGVPNLTSPKGELVNAVHGFTSMLFKVWRELKPKYVIATFDYSSKTFRKARYPEYKATRGPAPEGLSPQFPIIFNLLDCMNIPIHSKEGFEADDLLGTLSKQAEAQGLDVVILTGDMDALQLVSPHTRVLTSRRGFSDTVLYDEAQVVERYGFGPTHIPDFKALRGDSSDNIPGVPGIGDKTASKLIQQFGTIETMYEQMEKVSAKQKALLEPLHDQVVMAKDLATIIRDVDITLDLTNATLGDFDRQRVVALFHELGFRRMLDDISRSMGGAAETGGGGGADTRQMSLFAEAAGEAASADGAAADPSASARQADDGIVRTAEQLDAALAVLRTAPSIALNMQTVGTLPMRAEVVGVGLAASPEARWYIPVGHLDGGEQLAWSDVRDRLTPLMADAGVAKWSHNAKFHEMVLARNGVEVEGLAFDTMIAAYLLESNQRAFALRDLAWNKLQQEMPAASTLLGTGRGATTMDRLPVETVAQYARDEAVAVCRLVPILDRELHEAGLGSLFREVELPLVPVLATLERNGIAVDVPYLHAMSKELAERLAEIERDAYASVGHEFNINSPTKLGDVLYKELKLPQSKRTRTGQASTGAEVLEELRGAHPVIDLVLEHRQLQKLKSTYIDALPLMVNPDTGRVHGSFHQTVAATGRLSSSDPNLQNIPIRTDMGKRVRRAFVTASSETCLLSADYSQIELRVLAHYTKDPTLVEAFAEGQDIHAATAAEVLNRPIAEVTSDERRLAKVVNFGVLYGMSEYGLAQQSGLPQEQAAAFIKQYFERFGTVKAFQDNLLKEAEERGYVTTLLERRRYIPELTSPIRNVRMAGARMAINHPIQGTASDIVKIAMIEVQKRIEAAYLGTLMVLQVHDELLFELPRGSVETFAADLRTIMCDAMKLDVPLNVELRSGDNWEELKHLELPAAVGGR